MKTLLHKILFGEDTRKGILISDTNIMRLATDRQWFFETDSFLGAIQMVIPETNSNKEFVQTALYNPQAVRNWIAVQVVHNEPTDSTNYIRTINADNFERYWDGGAWSEATDDLLHWNTIDDFQTNFPTYPVDRKGIAFKIAQSTTGEETPSVFAIKTAWKGEVVELEDVVINSLVPYLKGIKAVGDLAQLIMETTGTVVGFDPVFQLEEDSGMTFQNIAAVFNHTDDPEHIVNLFSSFDSGLNEITLTNSVNSGKELFVQFSYSPEVQISAGQLFYELANWPTITIEEVNAVNSKRITFGDFIITEWTPVRKGLRVTAYRQLDFQIRLKITTTKNVDQIRLSGALKDALNTVAVLPLIDIGGKTDLVIVDPYTTKFEAQRSDLRSGELSFRLLNISFWEVDPEEVFLPNQFDLTTDSTEGVGA